MELSFQSIPTFSLMDMLEVNKLKLKESLGIFHITLFGRNNSTPIVQTDIEIDECR